MSRLELIFILVSFICLGESARILSVFPSPSISHQIVFRPLMLELVKRGHEVVVITTDPAYPKGETPSNLTEIDLHDLSYKLWNELFVIKKKGTKEGFYDQYKSIIQMLSVLFDSQLKCKEMNNFLQDKNKTFDLIFIEAYFRPALAFSYLYKAPVILISSMGTFYGNEEIIRASIHPILYPSVMHHRIYNLTLWEKLTNIYMDYLMRSYFYSYEEEENKMLRSHFGVDFPPLSELKNKVDMLFLNVHPLWQGNPSMPPSVVNLGGIHQKPEKPLPQDLKSFLDSSQNGVIYVSFGTNVRPSLLPTEKIHILVSVLSQLPYDVLWKWDKDELPGQTKNIRISKWYPQSDLLRHPKTKLFVTQGGLQSTDEAITAGVPLVGIPMLGDQWYNMEKYAYHKIGVKVEMDTITEANFMKAIKTVIDNESYRRNVVKLRDLMNDQPQSPLERAVWWTEHVIRHGSGRHLRSPAANISWTEYLELKLISIVALVLLILFVIFVAAIALLINYINRKFKSKLKKH